MKGPVVTHNDPKLPIELANDASSNEIASDIYHFFPDGSEHTKMEYVSRTLCYQGISSLQLLEYKGGFYSYLYIDTRLNLSHEFTIHIDGLS